MFGLDSACDPSKRRKESTTAKFAELRQLAPAPPLSTGTFIEPHGVVGQVLFHSYFVVRSLVARLSTLCCVRDFPLASLPGATMFGLTALSMLLVQQLRRVKACKDLGGHERHE